MHAVRTHTVHMRCACGADAVRMRCTCLQEQEEEDEAQQQDVLQEVVPLEPVRSAESPITSRAKMLLRGFVLLLKTFYNTSRGFFRYKHG